MAILLKKCQAAEKRPTPAAIRRVVKEEKTAFNPQSRIPVGRNTIGHIFLIGILYVIPVLSGKNTRYSEI